MEQQSISGLQDTRHLLCSLQEHMHTFRHTHMHTIHMSIYSFSKYQRPIIKTQFKNHLIKKSPTCLNKVNDPFLYYPAHLFILLLLRLLHYNYYLYVYPSSRPRTQQKYDLYVIFRFLSPAPNLMSGTSRCFNKCDCENR